MNYYHSQKSELAVINRNQILFIIYSIIGYIYPQVSRTNAPFFDVMTNLSKIETGIEQRHIGARNRRIILWRSQPNNCDALWSIQGKKHYLQAAIVGGIHHTGKILR